MEVSLALNSPVLKSSGIELSLTRKYEKASFSIFLCLLTAKKSQHFLSGVMAKNENWDKLSVWFWNQVGFPW